MSIWATEKVIKWSLRFCSSRFLWQQRGLQVTTADNKSFLTLQQFAHILGSRQSQKSIHRSLVSAVRFFSQDRNYSDELEDRKHLSSKLSLPAEMQFDKVASEQKPKRSPFTDYLQLCDSPSDVLDLTCKYSLTGHQVSNCLTKMWSSMKKMSDDKRPYELQLMFEHQAFDKLLQKALNSVNRMRNDDIAYSLLSMVNLGVPQHSRVVQTFLRACQEKLNSFDEKGLSILASCLEHMEESANVNALKEGVRLVFEAQLPGIQKVMTLQTVMRILGKDASKELKWKLEQKALLMADQFSLPNAQHMIYTMAKIGFYSKPLMQVCSKKITENLHGIPFNRLYDVLLSCKELLYRDVDMLPGISEYTAFTLDIWTNKQLSLLLSVFEDLLFCPDALMEAYAGKMIANPDALTLEDLLCVLRVYSSLNYDLRDRRQQFLDCLSDALVSYLPKMSGFDLLKAVYGLCVMGHFPAALLEQLLQSSTVEQLLATKFPKEQEMMFRTIDACLRFDRPHLPQSLTVPTSLLGTFTPNHQTVNPWLSLWLQKVLGDQADTRLQETVLVENIYIIDGLITKRVPNRSSVTELSPAESSQRIAVIYAPSSGFCYGTSKPRGRFAVKIRHLKTLGYTPVPVTEKDLQSESEEERTENLRGRIFPDHTT